MTCNCILSLINQPTTNKYLAGKVLPICKLPVVQLRCYSCTLSLVNGAYQPKTSERRHGWEISFKSALLLVAEGVISTFFGDMPHWLNDYCYIYNTLTAKCDYSYKLSNLRRCANGVAFAIHFIRLFRYIYPSQKHFPAPMLAILFDIVLERWYSTGC